MKQIVRAIEVNNPRSTHRAARRRAARGGHRHAPVVKKGEVAASTFDRPTEEHTQVAELTIERAKRLVESGIDVVVVLDGITFRLAGPTTFRRRPTGWSASGGIDTGRSTRRRSSSAPPATSRRWFHHHPRHRADRHRLRMDEVIFEGSSRALGIWSCIRPAPSPSAGSTLPSRPVQRVPRAVVREEELQQVQVWWRCIAFDGGNGATPELLIDRTKTFVCNDVPSTRRWRRFRRLRLTRPPPADHPLGREAWYCRLRGHATVKCSWQHVHHHSC